MDADREEKEDDTSGCGAKNNRGEHSSERDNVTELWEVEDFRLICWQRSSLSRRNNG